MRRSGAAKPALEIQSAEAAVAQEGNGLFDRSGVTRKPGMGRLDDDMVGHSGHHRALH
jgi:hypothetical protein